MRDRLLTDSIIHRLNIILNKHSLRILPSTSLKVLIKDGVLTRHGLTELAINYIFSVNEYMLISVMGNEITYIMPFVDVNKMLFSNESMFQHIQYISIVTSHMNDMFSNSL